MEKKTDKSLLNQASAIAGNEMSRNAQAGTAKAIAGMDLFKWKASRVSKVGFEQAKGNLFEYIEAAKLEKNLANAGHFLDQSPLTDLSKAKGGFGENKASDDFRFIKKGKTVGRAQAKFNNDTHKAALNFSQEKYMGMDRVAPIDQINQIKAQLDNMVNKGEISHHAYADAVKHLQYEGLTDPTTDISSGGTSTNEIRALCGKDGKISQEAVEKYARKFEHNQYVYEVQETVKNNAVASAITCSLVSGVTNFYEVLKQRKALDDALKDIGVDTVKGAVRGGATGFFSSLLHIAGTKNKIPVISDSSASTVIAGSIIDTGVAVYSYGIGEISAEEFKNQLQDTAIKATTTIYFTKAITAVVGQVNPFMPMAIYSAASYVVTSTRAVIENAKLNAEEYRRLATLLDESTELMKQYHDMMIQQLGYYESTQRMAMREFLDTFDYNIKTGDNYDQAIWSMVTFANQTGIALQHINFDEFKGEMLSKRDFILK